MAITAIALKRFSLSDVGPPLDKRAGDARQASLLGAGWTLGSLKAVAQANGAASATYYEATGPRGLMHGRLLSRDVFPLYHVFADVAEFGGDVVASKSSEPLRVEGLCLRKGNKTRVLLANMTHELQTIVLNKLNTNVLIKKTLDETNAAHALHQPEQWRAEKGERVLTKSGKLSVTLLPYALARLDF